MSTSSSAIAGPSQSRVETNSRGIPHAPFISNVQEYLGGPDEDVEPTLKKFQETMSKYKFMELNTAQRRRGLEEKIPDIHKTLQMVNFLKEKKDDPESIETTFELNDTLFAKAKLDPVDSVHLWLGANVMLEYPIDEAISLLTSKLSGAEKSLASSKEDLDFLREQITIMEVNTARVHNWDVKRRRERREQLERDGLTEEKDAAKASQASRWLSDDRDTSERPALSRNETGEESSRRGVADAIKDQQHAGGTESKAADKASTMATEQQSESDTQIPKAQSIEKPDDNAATTKIDEANGSTGTATWGQKPDAAQSTSTSSTETVTKSAPAEPNAPSVSPASSSNPNPIDRISNLPTSLTSPAAGDLASSTTLIVPPLNFSMVSRGIYRSGHPNERNFEFLRRLNLKSVLYLGTEDYRSNMTNWTASQNIRAFHLRLAINKEPTAEMDEVDVVKALQLILKPENWPILIHCNKGKYRVGCIVGLVRRLQGWSHTSIFEEYSRFAGTKISDLEYIEVFDLSKVSLTS
ncbi:hypothetical protein NDA14_005671 [Ustilago hordei]|uniref:Related to prefoldin subunit 3 n=1 Tax=Ustilago hordei TaxID=120017 RepID=I2FX91_USTHO|nr:uncharacterized protein UHO2_04375 [Ustilago hordei]KAJ1036942.1 hypothetical protein NDA10_005774 [Ustilago hordei]KAJ1598644.1 hypothetical protein NDA14_005671 [Ustilago hordei]UTT91141.1 hypothetical protein NDA17_006553 [Ustilago hordei]CCF51534.1 related to prefoldin subunit 3 [Ustilago hordei]SYW79732.1 related to prefoldin subunit 3 [Ustilago hordei]